MNRDTERGTAPLRVLHVTSGDLWAGAEVQVHQLLRELARRPDIEVRVALFNDGELARRLRSDGVAVTIIDESRMGGLAIAGQLHRLMREFRPQLIHTHRSKENLLGLLANTFSVRAPMVRTIHGANEHPTRWRQPQRHLIQLANEWSGRHLTRTVIAVSEALGASLRHEHGYRNVTVIANGIDAQAIRATQEPASFITPDRKTRHIAFAGRLEPVKRGDLFVDTAAQLLRLGLPYPLHFHLFGEGSQRPALEAQAARLGLADTLQFHGHQPDLSRWLGSLDVLLLCSDHEGLPMVLLEALAVGVPVVGHAVGGIAEVMAGNVGGLLVQSHEPQAYAEAVARILRNGWSNEQRTAAMTRLLDRYSAQHNANLTRALYQDCLRQRR